MISPLLASGIRVGRLRSAGQRPVVFAVEGRPTNLDNGRARDYCVCRRCELGLFGYFFFSRLSFFFLPLSRMDGRMTWGFAFFSTEFKL